MAMNIEEDPTYYEPNSRVLQWIHTRKHIIDTNDEKDTIGNVDKTTTDDASISVPSRTPAGSSPRSIANYSSEDSTQEQISEPVSIDLLVGCDDDPLIPSTDEINRMFCTGREIWGKHLADSDLPSGDVLADCLDPYLAMQDIPPLPQNLQKKQTIKGRTLWHIPSPEFSEGLRLDPSDVWDPEYVYGPEKTFYLWSDKPTLCGVTSRPDFRYCASETQSGDPPNGLAILTLCWSYILSVRLIEMQKRRVRYSTLLSPLSSEDIEPQSNEVVIHLGHASKRLVRWLRAVLAPGLGWFVKGRLPPWIAHYEGNVRFVVTTTQPVPNIGNEKPPSAGEAVDLLLEFCKLYPFGSQPVAAFLAALMLPIHNEWGFQPRLHLPRIDGYPGSYTVATEPIRKLEHDLPYFMTLSICPRNVGSAIWSIFWEPGVQCNLTSPWLGSILEVISPILEAGDAERLAKVFAFRRRRLAPLWLGIFLCGCPEVMSMIKSYLQTLEERPYHGSWARPDSDVALWTGSRQSFFDEICSGPYLSQESQVLRADVLRHRFEFRLGDGVDIIHFGWQPFGTIKKTEIEPELWPRLECKPESRKYIHWLWWLAEDESIVEIGLRHDEGKTVDSVTKDRFVLSAVTIPSGFHCKVRLEPSKQATFRVLDWGSRMASGERCIDAVAIPGVKDHIWLSDAREIL